jgi:restriction system protein
MAQTYYSVEIRNDYLGKYRRVTGRTWQEVQVKAAEQLHRWHEQELRTRDRAAGSDLKQAAIQATYDASALIQAHRNILQATLGVNDRLDWGAMKDTRPYDRPAPTLEDFNRKFGVPPEQPLLEALRLVSKSKRLKLETAARQAHQAALWEFENARANHDAAQMKQNEEIDAFRKAYEDADIEAIERYISLVLAGSALPPGLERDCRIQYSPTDKTLLIEAAIPSPDEIPTVLEYRFIASRRAVEERRMKDKDVADFYEDVILQLTLRTIHEVFEGDYVGHCQVVVFNGVVHAVDRATGRDYHACIVSCQAEREAVERIDLGRVDVRACFRLLKGLSGSRLIGLQPVRPIRVLDMEDARFIDAEGVLDGLEADQNLMTMDWQDFEVLVGDLFTSMFGSRGAEVRVTRGSRDQGVDAVVFGPDPLTGGKMVVQAKRYRGPVPVAAVRELYGTMLNEGAGKGILVTTSHFGAGSLEFAKDKPITLVDGGNLLHYLQNHGHHVRIDLSEVREDLLADPDLPASP